MNKTVSRVDITRHGTHPHVEIYQSPWTPDQYAYAFLDWVARQKSLPIIADDSRHGVYCSQEERTM
jgi:hypothetical protein